MSSVFGGGDPLFDAQPRSINWFMQQIEEGYVALPDFQRDFVWDPARVRDLLVSVMCRYPAGALLTLVQGDAMAFAPRVVAGAPPLTDGNKPKLLVLDGQQRLTSLYQAHRGVGDARYLVHLGDLVDSNEPLDVDKINFDELVTFENVKPSKLPQSDDIAWQYENWTFPVHSYLTSGFDQWLNGAVQHHGGDSDLQLKRRVRMGDIRDTLLNPLGAYHFPVIELSEKTSLPAVCKIFETLNMQGVTLSVFELLTARVWAYGHDLRQMWATAQTEHPVLNEFNVDAYSVLQAVTLRGFGSAQRSKVLELTDKEIAEYWGDVVEGFASALEYIRDQCWIQTAKWLPYATILVPIAAAWNEMSDLPGPANGEARERMKQFFWCSVFMTNYDQGGNSQAQADYALLRVWAKDPTAAAPEAVADFAFSTSQLANAKRNRRALYRGVMALVMQSGALDFHSKERITAAKIKSSDIDAHHLFPRNWLKQNYAPTKVDPLSEDLILNFALIDSGTNGVIRDKAPSKYLADLSTASLGGDRDRILRSHVIGDSTRKAFLDDQYEDFIVSRASDVADEIERVTGKHVVRDEEPKGAK